MNGNVEKSAWNSKGGGDDTWGGDPGRRSFLRDPVNQGMATKRAP